MTNFTKILRYMLNRSLLFIGDFLISCKKHGGIQSNKVLVIRLDSIGDFILWLDAAKELRNLFPQDVYEITLLGNQAWASLAEKLPYFDEVWSLDRNKFLNNFVYRFKILKRIRKTVFDTIIQPTFSREFLLGDAIVRICGAKERIGSQGDYSNINKWQKRITDRWYTRLIPATKEPLMELERNAEFIRGLGLIDFRAGVPEFLPSCTTPVGINIKDYYILFPGTSTEIRQWPLSHFKDLAVRIYQSTGWAGLVCGGHGEELLGRRLAQDLDVPLQNWAGRTSLQELAAIIRGARIIIGNDTSAIHMAAAVSTPAVCILGGGHFGRFMPYRLEKETKKILPVAVIHKMDCFGCNWHCIYPIQKGNAAPCVTEISVNAVWDETIKILKRKRYLLV